MTARRLPLVLLLLTSLSAWTMTLEAQSRRAKPKPRRPAATKPTPAAAATAKVVREAPLMQCPAVLGNGVTSQRLFCEILAGTEAAAGLRVTLPAHQGAATLLFTLHNRQIVSDPVREKPSSAKTSTTGTNPPAGPGWRPNVTSSDLPLPPPPVFARYTAAVRIVGPGNKVLGQAVVQSEYRGPTDLVERIAGMEPGNVKPVAPTGSEPIVIDLPAGVNEVTLIGDRLTVERVGSTQVIAEPGQPIAIVSQVQIEYRPASSSASRPR